MLALSRLARPSAVLTTTTKTNLIGRRITAGVRGIAYKDEVKAKQPKSGSRPKLRPKPKPKSKPRKQDTPLLGTDSGALKLSATTTAGDTLAISWTARGLAFPSKLGTPSRVAYLPEQLRDSCSCPACRDVSSGQKSFGTTQVRSDMNIVDVQPTSEGGLTVTVDVDMDTHGGQGGHDIQLSPWWLLSQVGLDSKGRKQPPLQLRLPRRYKPEHWDGESLSRRIRRVDYASFMQEASSPSSPSSPDNVPFWDVVGDLMRLGIVVLTGVPRDEDSVARIANRVANVRETFYGHTFDVRAKPNAENIAYTSGYLGLHQDLLYLDPPPFIQILHCMDNSCAGGESLFSDADRVGRLLAALQDDYPAPVQCLASVPIPYGYRRDGNWYHQRRKLLNLALRDAKLYENVYWSPPFQAEMTIPAPDMAEWIPAARVFEDAVNSPGAVYQTRMEPGDCVLFNNLRVLHGRRAFDAEGGSRWLRGTYISREDFLSTAMHAPETHAAPVDNPHTWWDPDESNRELLESPLCLELKGRLLKCQNPS